ncbi:unnamed protein product, partial [Ectocarpus fasciculatus]
SFTGNYAGENGGAIAIYRSYNSSIIGATFKSNQATDYGGAVWMTSADEQDDDQVLVLSSAALFGELVFENNTAGSDGGALWLDRHAAYDELWNSSFGKNRA